MSIIWAWTIGLRKLKLVKIKGQEFNLYPSATGKKAEKYCIVDGANYRKEIIALAKERNKYGKQIKFREQELIEDFITFLAKKALHHLSMASMAFINFGTKFKPNLELEEAFLKILRKDYQMTESQLSTFDNALDEYKEIHFPYIDHDPSASKVELAGGTISDIYNNSDFDNFWLMSACFWYNFSSNQPKIIW